MELDSLHEEKKNERITKTEYNISNVLGTFESHRSLLMSGETLSIWILYYIGRRHGLIIRTHFK